MPMPKSLTKHTLLLDEGTYRAIGEAYPGIPVAAIIRKLITAHLEKLNPPVDLSLIKETLDD